MTDASLLISGNRYTYRQKTLTYRGRGDDRRGKFTYIFTGARGGEVVLSERAVYNELFELEPESLPMPDFLRELIAINGYSCNKPKMLDLGRLEAFNE